MTAQIPIERARIFWRTNSEGRIEALRVMHTSEQGLPCRVFNEYPFDAGNSCVGWGADQGPADLFEELHRCWGWASIDVFEQACKEFEKLGFCLTLKAMTEKDRLAIVKGDNERLKQYYNAQQTKQSKVID